LSYPIEASVNRHPCAFAQDTIGCSSFSRKLIAKFYEWEIAMQSDQNSSEGLAAIVEEVFAFGKKQVSAMAKPKALSIPPHSPQINPDAALEPVSLGSNRAPNTRNELKTAAELAAMIEADLAQHPECPKSGFRITVYGATHWRAMLTIAPAAGRIREPQKWRDLTDQLAERLRPRYDLAW
jgi:hypothetical protein